MRAFSQDAQTEISSGNCVGKILDFSDPHMYELFCNVDDSKSR